MNYNLSWHALLNWNSYTLVSFCDHDLTYRSWSNDCHSRYEFLTCLKYCRMPENVTLPSAKFLFLFLHKNVGSHWLISSPGALLLVSLCHGLFVVCVSICCLSVISFSHFRHLQNLFGLS